MLLIPAIDLQDGRCVRLKQGDFGQATIFSETPAAMARHWVAQGAKRLHLVDLNGALAGKPENTSAIRAIINAVGTDIPVQLGGGIRDLDTIEHYLDYGVAYIILGTAAVKNPGLVREACLAFQGHIMVGLDARQGVVATDGWSKLSGHDAVDLAKKFEDYGCAAIIYTDISRDGMLDGINIDETRHIAQAVTVPVIASGGLAGLADIKALCAVEVEGIAGVICGRALYTGALDFTVAQKVVDEYSTPKTNYSLS
jgi:phosphoribosylformimino-5-aminoimidazole carboxamide ribotide isomerase